MAFTDHQLAAAVRVARAIDQSGNSSEDARSTYRLILSQGEHRSDDFVVGETVLTAVGLLTLMQDRLSPAKALAVLAAMHDAEGVAYLRRLFARQASEVDRAEIGLLGESAVLAACRTEATSLGRPDVAQLVQQVSLLDDSLGYDIVAPMFSPGAARHIEVKTSRSATEPVFPFFLTRNEFDVGRREPTMWALVACTCAAAVPQVAIIGWCRAQAIQPYLPDDRNGRWTEALVRLPRAALFDGIPPAV